MLPIRPNLSAHPFYLAEVPGGALPEAKRVPTPTPRTPQAAGAPPREPPTGAPPRDGLSRSALQLFLVHATTLLGQAEALLGTAHDAALATLGQLYVALTDGVDALYRQGVETIASVRRNLDLNLKG
jgi:hypothetical protein